VWNGGSGNQRPPEERPGAEGEASGLE